MRLAFVFTAVATVMVCLYLYMLKTGEPPAVVVRLSPGPSQPRVPLAEAGMDPVVVEQAAAWAGERNSTALVVAHGGHIVFEKYWGETGFDTAVDPGFAPVLVALLTGTALNDRLIHNLDRPVANYLGGDGGAAADVPVRQLLAGERTDLSLAQSTDLLALMLERLGRQPYQALVAERLWRPMGGGDLEFSVRDNALRPGGVSAACCVRARIGDWMRIGEMLANDGVFEGNQYTPPRYVSAMLKPVRKDAARGFFTRTDGDFISPDVAWLEGPEQQRMWIVPSLRLVILRLGGKAPSSREWDERMIPDSIIRGTSGWRPSPVGGSVDPGKFAPH